MADTIARSELIAGVMELTCERCHRVVPCQFLLDLDGQAAEQKIKCAFCGHEDEINDELKRTFEREYVRHKQRQDRVWSRVWYWLVIVLSALPLLISVFGPVAYVLIYQPALNESSIVVGMLMWLITWIVGGKIFRKPVRFYKVFQ